MKHSTQFRGEEREKIINSSTGRKNNEEINIGIK